jgi:hypothetical protein
MAEQRRPESCVRLANYGSVHQPACLLPRTLNVNLEPASQTSFSTSRGTSSRRLLSVSPPPGPTPATSSFGTGSLMRLWKPSVANPFLACGQTRSALSRLLRTGLCCDSRAARGCRTLWRRPQTSCTGAASLPTPLLAAVLHCRSNHPQARSFIIALCFCRNAPNPEPHSPSSSIYPGR